MPGPPHSVADHTDLEFRPHPVSLASPLSNSSAEHRRAPAAAQKFTASSHWCLMLQPPRPRSLSPHTDALPYSPALVQPRVAHVYSGSSAQQRTGLFFAPGEHFLPD
eukprot:CAMPEP_0171620590 /NCGR_PEP_ID=MMETSP0990-20121206/16079_1 /TAXON_ID=483369 /ORGANISM="non described non described, Strain CCMP2098" /LENGTH=106 /DNA_ID=CAMNT_0012185907 /DNA_START=330 /DNA_END=650 /DNA_ORIENTATION=-